LRLNRGGDRQANCAFYTITMARLRWHQRTQDYVRRRVAEGKSHREAIGCLKRYIAREIYRDLTATPTPNWRLDIHRDIKNAINYRAGVVVSAVITWLKALLGDVP
jgi:transposase